MTNIFTNVIIIMDKNSKIIMIVALLGLVGYLCLNSSAKQEVKEQVVKAVEGPLGSLS